MVTRVIKIQVVTARIEEKEAFCRAQVAAGEAVAGVCLEETNIRVREGESKKLTSSVLPENAADKRVARESSDRAVAEVDAYGNVRGVSVGTALIARTGTGRRSARRRYFRRRTRNIRQFFRAGKIPPGNARRHLSENPDKDQPQNSGGNQTEVPDKNQLEKLNPPDNRKPDSRLKEGSILTDSRTSAICRITGLSPGEAEYIGCAKKKIAVIVPDSVTAGGKTFSVTGIAKSALKGNKKLKSVVVGKNIKTIGEKAFYGCKSLKKLTIKSKVLKKVGKNAFKGIHAKARIKVPKAKLKAYKRLLKKKGQGRKVQIRK